ncbi:hypothetical protein COT75_03900 [Candidatus Beckwithbacteria bacterium CG10_big_fil_rev_8_21_14_0_10_34_10]|uniref:DUF4829 domain-containing protein n=1 Tax=Candidatus Beckwithbacteria bacterium CG10_big_fil_rev_8_21_14_0_10_34_10 TaxID=1974495 RepID=A0A2H0W8J1_9BACT|nr:MAG: hypothetical protein COT75_03900 [Candidatus Beckwithbacteria bacterium CG10_big_fil_rev_8_21_14_0_10_34_10]
MKKIILCCLGVFLLSSCTVSNFSNQQTETENVADQEASASPILEKLDPKIPIPNGLDVVNLFFNLINERRIDEAVGMMSAQNTNNDSSKQAWGVHFNAIKSIKVIDIEPANPDSWTASYQTYKATLEAYVSSETANAPIPYYGWEDNPNIRWVVLVKEGDFWKIDTLATSP